MGTGFNNQIENPLTDTPGLVRDLILDTTSPTNLKLYAAGDFTAYNGTACDEIIRIRCSSGAGTMDNVGQSSFTMINGGTNGINNGPVWCMKKQADDGKIIIGGQFKTYANGISALYVTRILPVNGSPAGELRGNSTYYDSEPEINIFSTDDLEINPNPSSGIINFTTLPFECKLFSISVYNTIGQKVDEKKNISSEIRSIDLSDLRKGVYFITFKNENKNITKKIILK